MRTLLLPPPPPWSEDLLARVDRAFAVTGAGTPAWPDPHRGGCPSEEEYSRCLDPGKYQILGARADAWVRALASCGMATADDIPPSAWTGALRGRDALRRVRRLTPVRAGGAGVLLGETLVDGEPFGLDLGLFDPSDTAQIFLDTVPDCGCDACDSGSEDLLAVLDGWILCVARGGVLHARSASASVTRTLDGWQASGDEREVETWLDPSLPAPPDVRRRVGEPWA